MPRTSPLVASMNTGEISPNLWARLDFSKYPYSGGDEQDQRAANNVEQMLRRAERTYSNNPNAKIGDGSLWRPWEIQTPALTRTHQAAVRALRRRNSTEGLYVTRPERWSVDGAIVGRPSRAFGASLLIDVSGSMHLTPEQVDEIIAKAPAAVIATYTSNGVRGVICVIAKNGRRVGDAEELHPFGVGRGCNGIDGPALEWLAQQRGPCGFGSMNPLTGRTWG